MTSADALSYGIAFAVAAAITFIATPIVRRMAIRVGAVYDPCRDEMFAASLSSHSTLNGNTIGVQQISEGYDAFEKAWVGTDWPHEQDKFDQAMEIATIMSHQVISLSAMGSPALGLCNVACGRMHAYWALDMKIWDLAAGGLILTRAGGTLTDDHGNSWLYSGGGYIASNSVIHGWTLRCLQRVLQKEKLPPGLGRTASRPSSSA